MSNSRISAGIWDAERKRVIHFTATDDRGFSARSCASGDKFSGTGVTADTLEKFLNYGSIRLYVYGCSSLAWFFKASGSCTCEERRNSGESIVEIARWFASEPKAFGNYDLLGWNCESFAVFCSTTSLASSELPRAYERLKGSPGEWHRFLLGKDVSRSPTSEQGMAHQTSQTIASVTSHGYGNPGRHVATAVQVVGRQAYRNYFGFRVGKVADFLSIALRRDQST